MRVYIEVKTLSSRKSGKDSSRVNVICDSFSKKLIFGDALQQLVRQRSRKLFQVHSSQEIAPPGIFQEIAPPGILHCLMETPLRLLYMFLITILHK